MPLLGDRGLPTGLPQRSYVEQFLPQVVRPDAIRRLPLDGRLLVAALLHAARRSTPRPYRRAARRASLAGFALAVKPANALSCRRRWSASLSRGASRGRAAFVVALLPALLALALWKQRGLGTLPLFARSAARGSPPSALPLRRAADSARYVRSDWRRHPAQPRRSSARSSGAPPARVAASPGAIALLRRSFAKGAARRLAGSPASSSSRAAHPYASVTTAASSGCIDAGLSRRSSCSLAAASPARPGAPARCRRRAAAAGGAARAALVAAVVVLGACSRSSSSPPRPPADDRARADPPTTARALVVDIGLDGAPRRTATSGSRWRARPAAARPSSTASIGRATRRRLPAAPGGRAATASSRSRTVGASRATSVRRPRRRRAAGSTASPWPRTGRRAARWRRPAAAQPAGRRQPCG